MAWKIAQNIQMPPGILIYVWFLLVTFSCIILFQIISLILLIKGAEQVEKKKKKKGVLREKP